MGASWDGTSLIIKPYNSQTWLLGKVKQLGYHPKGLPRQYIPRGPMTSIFEGQPPQNKAEIPIKEDVMLLLGMYNHMLSFM